MSDSQLPMPDGEAITGKRILIAVLVSVVLFAIVLGALVPLQWLFDWNWRRGFPKPNALTDTVLTPPLPHLQVHGPRDLREKMKLEHDHLESYGWVDTDRDIVHIPIERAKAIVLQRGFPESRR